MTRGRQGSTAVDGKRLERNSLRLFFLGAGRSAVLLLADASQDPAPLLGRPRGEGSADALYPAAVLEREYGETITAVEGVAQNATGTLRNALSMVVVVVLEVEYLFLFVAELEDDLAQMFAVGERVRSEAPDAAGNNQRLDLTFSEPVVVNRLDPVREAQHLRILLESEMFWRPLRKRLRGNLSLPETEKSKFLNVLAQLEVIQ